MARLKVDSIRNRNDDGPPSLPKGETNPTGGTLGVNGDISVTGISTVGFLTQHVTVGIVPQLLLLVMVLV